MVISENCPLYKRLATGFIVYKHIDNPAFSVNQTFHKVAFQFNDENISMSLPSEAYDIYGIEEIKPNDGSRIRIT